MKKYLRLIIYIVIFVAVITGIIFLSRRGNNDIAAPKAGKPASGNAGIQSFVKNAESLMQQGDITAARDIYRKLIYDNPNTENFPELQNKLYELNIKLLFSATATPDSQLYEVVSGDSLIKIAQKFNTTVELIKKANNLSGNLIKTGMKLKIQNSIFSIVADKSQNKLMLSSNGEVVKVYDVSTGKDNSTPVGTFKIINKLIDPPWYSAKGVIAPDSPENVLGTRWLGIDRLGYGIHGTTDPQSIGSQCTEGCVRMHNSDIEELYAIVPIGVEVTIID